MSWSQHLLAFAAALRAESLVRRFRPGRAVAAQDAARRHLIRQLSRTAFGQAEGILPAMAYADFRRRVALRGYEDFAPWIARMQQGESDLLWPGQCRHYAVSSGTTAGRTKYLPVTAELLAHFRKTGLDSLCLYARRAGGTVFHGRHLLLGGATSLAPIPALSPRSFQAYAGDLSGITAKHLPRWVEHHLYEPGGQIAQLADWPAKIRAIAERTASRDVRLLAGIPAWILVLAEALRERTGHRTLGEVWPRLECLVHGGVPVGPFAAALRTALGPGVRFHEVYPASEGFIAAQDEEAGPGLRLLADAGIFYEFLPLSRFEAGRLAQLGEAAVPLEGVAAGVDYVLLMTTPAGLVRYVIGDVVRFVSTEPPRLIYVGRTQLQLSAFGEHVIEKEATDALLAVCARRSIQLKDFHVAPRFAGGAPESRGCHEWWLEPAIREARDPRWDPVTLAAEVDAELRRLNDDYDSKRRGGGMSAPLIRLAPAGTFERWLRARGKWGGQNKTPRCRSDREVADELTLLAELPARPVAVRAQSAFATDCDGASGATGIQTSMGARPRLFQAK